jgi:hypothetical protein
VDFATAKAQMLAKKHKSHKPPHIHSRHWNLLQNKTAYSDTYAPLKIRLIHKEFFVINFNCWCFIHTILVSLFSAKQRIKIKRNKFLHV